MAFLFRVIDAGVRGNLRQGARALSTVSLADPTYIVWSPNTDIGKTIICGGLAKVAADCGEVTSYIKPVQTGFPADSDGRLVSRILGCNHTVAPHASYCEHGTPGVVDSFPGKQPPTNTAATLHAWKTAVSPHLAVRLEGRSVTDRELCDSVQTHVAELVSQQAGRRFGIVETAGGVCSPTPAGSRQVDVLRNLRMPGVLVADPRLGGISTTLSALDSLTMQGQDIVAVAIMDTGAPTSTSASSPQLDNADAISEHVTFAPGATPPKIFQLPPLGPKPSDWQATDEHIDPALAQWLVDAAEPLKAMHAHLREWHERRVARLVTAPAAARGAVWWPFTQHKGMTDGSITLIDSRVGEKYSVVRGHSSAAGASDTTATDLEVVQEYDGCASWWTQGVSGELQPAVQRQMAYAAGRYMHVIFPEAVHEPALALCERLLATVGRGWAGKVFFSDDGSTAVEVALKMAFKKYAAAQGLSFQSPAARSLQVVALTNGYHGDTLGVMDCCPRSVFNELQTPWYTPRGLFLEPPTCGVSHGRWEVRLPPEICGVGADEHDIHDTVAFESKDALYSPSRLSTALAAAYTQHVEHALDNHEAANAGARVGACLLEPGMQGAGGMLMLDPLFQNILARVCQARSIPVIADEVFSGLWRLGTPSAAAAAGITPDIACYAKLLTAGSIPLAVTLASDDVFHAFDGDSKAQALLHGHSYTAHPVGCQVALASLDALGDARYNPNILEDGNLWELWPQDAVTAISHNPAVERVVALGTVLAIDLKVAQGGAGYSSGAARAVCTRMRSMGVYARPLGNVAYIMCTPTTRPEDAQALVQQLQASLLDTGLNDSSSTSKKQATA